MIRELNDSSKYVAVMSALSALTFVFGLAYSFLGILFLPFAIAFCAALLLFEKPQKRFLSYIIPLSVIAISVIVGGWYGLADISFVIAAVILAISYRFGQTKAETAAYMTVIVFFTIVAILYLSGAKECGSLLPAQVAAYYSDALKAIKEQLTESIIAANKAAPQADNKITPELIGEYFDSLTDLIVAMIGICAFTVSGIAIKVFSAISLRLCKNGILKSFAHFIPSKILAYVYVVISILSALMRADNTFSISVINASEVLAVVFFYVGIRYAFALGELFKNRSTFWLVLAVAFLLFPGAFLAILSYLGAWFAITLQREEIK